MRRICLFVFAAAVFFAVASAHAVEASCDLNTCMSICRSEYESGCVSMCGRIISRCKKLVLRQDMSWRGTKRLRRNSPGEHKQIESNARARSPQVP